MKDLLNLLICSEVLLVLRCDKSYRSIDAPETIKYQGNTIGKKTFSRSILNIHETRSIKGDPEL